MGIKLRAELCHFAAGLWEFPSVTVPAEASEKERRAEVDALLDRLLGAGRPHLEVQERRHLGSIVHIFSHIRMTLQVERLVVKASFLLMHIALGKIPVCSPVSIDNGCQLGSAACDRACACAAGQGIASLEQCR